MSWADFEKWLGSIGFRYTRGDIHYVGRGYWLPELPDITTGAIEPLPPAPWIRVARSGDEGRWWVESSFDKPFITGVPREARAEVERLMRSLVEPDEEFDVRDPRVARIRAPAAPVPVAPSVPYNYSPGVLAQRDAMEAARQAEYAPMRAKIRAGQEREERRLREGRPYVVNRDDEGNYIEGLGATTARLDPLVYLLSEVGFTTKDGRLWVGNWRRVFVQVQLGPTIDFVLARHRDGVPLDHVRVPAGDERALLEVERMATNAAHFDAHGRLPFAPVSRPPAGRLNG